MDGEDALRRGGSTICAYDCLSLFHTVQALQTMQGVVLLTAGSRCNGFLSYLFSSTQRTVLQQVLSLSVLGQYTRHHASSALHCLVFLACRGASA